jgi:hypothetical protein
VDKLQTKAVGTGRIEIGAAATSRGMAPLSIRAKKRESVQVFWRELSSGRSKFLKIRRWR